ncbi:Uncharacterized protein APZ42_024764 [Daphnia magna]|uniref:Uncharacterized protein n=1 Tax=Daphnia magna TaxID=35525 RepID=A0A164TS94_9CRUS|nr:Uncharacterized protein APZ42_024764 [Daphnia magna]
MHMNLVFVFIILLYRNKKKNFHFRFMLKCIKPDKHILKSVVLKMTRTSREDSNAAHGSMVSD